MMKKNRSTLISWFILLIIAIGVNSAYAQDPEAWEEQGAALVGRISHIEGDLSRYDTENDQWVATPQESPFGTGDLLQSGAESKAEFIMPNNTWLRIDADTQIQLLALNPKLSELDLPVGNARFINRSTNTEIKSTTPFGHVTAPAGAVFDLYVQENGVEVMAVKGSVYFTHNSFKDPLEVRSGSSAIFADIHEVTAAPGEMNYAWNKWNSGMDSIWAARFDTKGESAAYLPDELHSEAYPLDRDGVWEKVYYENGHYRFWRPLHVHAGWSPFTSGAWIVWHGEHVWVPNESFGYVTHHYGNWIFTAGLWYWAPPVTRVTIRAHRSLFRIGFGWYPGRVAWIHAGAHLGWIPLGPNEPYYTHRHWGRRSIVVTRGAKYHRHRPHRYKHRNHAVVIHRSHLYRSSNYRHARVRSISHTTIRKKFRTTPVLNSAVAKDHRSLRNKDRFRMAPQPHRSKRSSNALHHNNGSKKYTKAPSHQGRQRRITEDRTGRRTGNSKPARIHREQRQRQEVEEHAKKADRIKKRPPKGKIQTKAPKRNPNRIKSPQPKSRNAQFRQTEKNTQRNSVARTHSQKRMMASSKPGMNVHRYQSQPGNRKPTRAIKPQPYKVSTQSQRDRAVRQVDRGHSSEKNKWGRSSNHRTQTRTNRGGERHRNRK